jgi:uncharacterized membrane protein
MSLYELLKLIHVLAAIAWIGTAIEQQFVGNRATSSKDPRRIEHFVDEAEWVGVRVMTPAAIVVVIAGVAMVIESAWNFSDTWILIGIGLFFVTSLNGMLYLTPQSKKLKVAIADRGLDDEGVMNNIRTLTLASRIDLLVLVLIVADMVIKPGI